jgi:hypothetical protein
VSEAAFAEARVGGMISVIRHRRSASTPSFSVMVCTRAAAVP